MQRTLGTCYYPEQWPQDMWAQDAKRMVEAGLTWVRIGEFAWSCIEPEPYQLDWQWLDNAVATLGDAGLNVVMGTPTATPPRWMLDKYPQMLAVDQHGDARKFGSRRHYCFSHVQYQQECARICQLMAQRYADNPYVQAWQIDNEYSCHDTTLSYSLAALQGFRHWLAQKYQTIAALNTRWGNVFWSMHYNSFSQIELPNLCVTQPNPVHVLDFKRFSSEQVVAFNRIQVDVLRKYTNASLIHNYMGRITDFDHFEVGKDLDIASWDSYPLGFLEDRSDGDDAHKLHFSQQGDPDFQAFHHDLYRSVGRKGWWVMEQQPGPVNWAPYNPAPLPGMVRLWSWEAFAHGAQTVCYFRWRQAPFAQEQMHAGLYYPDNSAALGLNEVAAVAAELKAMPEVSIGTAKVALVFDYESDWAWKTQPQGASFDYFTLVFAYYKALRALGLSIDIIDAKAVRGDHLNAYKLVLIPGLMHFNSALTKNLDSFNGSVLAGPRSGSKTVDFAINTGAIMPGLSNSVKHVQSLRADFEIPLQASGCVINWLETTGGGDPVIEQTLSGAPIHIGYEKRQYLCAWLNQQALQRVLKVLCEKEGIAVQSLPSGVRIRESAAQRFIFNYNPTAVEYKGLELPAAGVHWEAL
ncbi:MAG: beta-galactosidase [Oceanospirillaceae bacterium]|jgi:beta-galactosidase